MLWSDDSIMAMILSWSHKQLTCQESGRGFFKYSEGPEHQRGCLEPHCFLSQCPGTRHGQASDPSTGVQGEECQHGTPWLGIPQPLDWCEQGTEVQDLRWQKPWFELSVQPVQLPNARVLPRTDLHGTFQKAILQGAGLHLSLLGISSALSAHFGGDSMGLPMVTRLTGKFWI